MFSKATRRRSAKRFVVGVFVGWCWIALLISCFHYRCPWRLPPRVLIRRLCLWEHRRSRLRLGTQRGFQGHSQWRGALSVISYDKCVVFGRRWDTEGRLGHWRVGSGTPRVHRVSEGGRRGESHQLLQVRLAGRSLGPGRRGLPGSAPSRRGRGRGLRATGDLNGGQRLDLGERGHGGGQLDLFGDQVGRTERGARAGAGSGGGQHHGVELADVGSEAGHHAADLLHERALRRAAARRGLRVQRRQVVVRAAGRARALAQRANGRRRARARGRGEVLLGLHHVVQSLGAGVRGLGPASSRACAARARAAARAARAQAAALRALGEGLDDGSLVGVLFLVDVDGQPLPQVLPPATLLVLRPRDRFSIGAAERRETRGDSARPRTGGLPRWWAAMGLGLGRAFRVFSGNRASKDTRERDLGRGFCLLEWKAAFLYLVFRSSWPRKCVKGDISVDKGLCMEILQ